MVDAQKGMDARSKHMKWWDSLTTILTAYGPFFPIVGNSFASLKGNIG